MQAVIFDLEVARNHLDWADPRDWHAIDAAIHELAAAEHRFASEYRAAQGRQEERDSARRRAS